MTQQLSPSPLKNSLGFPFSFPRRLGAHGQRLCPRPRLAALSCTAPARAQIHGGTLPSRKGQGRDQHHVHLHWPSHRSSMRLFQNTHLKLLQAKKAEEGSCDPGLRVFNEAKPGFRATFPSFSHRFGTRALRPKRGAPETPAMPGGIATQPPRQVRPLPEAWSGPCLLEDRALTKNIRGS